MAASNRMKVVILGEGNGRLYMLLLDLGHLDRVVCSETVSHSYL